MVRVDGWMARQHGALCRFHDETLNRGSVLLERGGAARKGAASPREVAEGIDADASLFQDFGAGMQVVRPEITGMMELIGAKSTSLPGDSPGRLFHQFEIAAGDLSRPRIGPLIDHDDFRSQCPH